MKVSLGSKQKIALYFSKKKKQKLLCSPLLVFSYDDLCRQQQGFPTGSKILGHFEVVDGLD